MRIIQIPNRDYYLQKSKGSGFVFIPRYKNPKSLCGYISINAMIAVPKELVGKRLSFKVEVVE